MPGEMKNEIHEVTIVINAALERIADLNKLVPNLWQTAEVLNWMDQTMKSSPAELSGITDETLMFYMTEARKGTASLGSIPQMTPDLYSSVTISGSVLPSAYNRYVQRAAVAYNANPEVAKWAGITVAMGDEIREKQNKSDKVLQRLNLLNPDLGQHYSETIRSTFSSKTTADGPVAAAAMLDRVIERFKGELTGRFRRSEKAIYQNISDNFAFDTALAKFVVANGQCDYDRINTELMRIRKSMQPDDGNNVMKLLHDIEDHIIKITDALDPAKLGFTF